MSRFGAVLPGWLLVCLGLALASCARPDPPTIKPRSAEVTQVTAKGLIVKTVLDVHNPNGFALRARSVRAKVVLGKKVTLGPVDIPRKVTLPAKKTTQLTVEIPASWANAAQITTLAASSPTIPYVVDGQVVVGGKRLNAEVDFEIEGQVSRAQLVQAGLKGLPILDSLPIPNLAP